MRERKFRAWDRGRKEMGTVLNLNTDYNDARLVSENYGVWAANVVCIMESTSRKDMNDKEIYEGDIVTFVDQIIDDNNNPYLDSAESRILHVKYQFWNVGKVFWDENRVGFDVSNRRSVDIDCVWDNIRVIGNIFENPELLLDYELPKY